MTHSHEPFFSPASKEKQTKRPEGRSRNTRSLTEKGSQEAHKPLAFRPRKKSGSFPWSTCSWIYKSRHHLALLSWLRSQLPLFWSTPVLVTTPISPHWIWSLYRCPRSECRLVAFRGRSFLPVPRGRREIGEKRADQQGVDVTICVTDRWVHTGTILFLLCTYQDMMRLGVLWFVTRVRAYGENFSGQDNLLY